MDAILLILRFRGLSLRDVSTEMLLLTLPFRVNLGGCDPLTCLRASAEPALPGLELCLLRVPDAGDESPGVFGGSGSSGDAICSNEWSSMLGMLEAGASCAVREKVERAGGGPLDLALGFRVPSEAELVSNCKGGPLPPSSPDSPSRGPPGRGPRRRDRKDEEGSQPGDGAASESLVG